MIDTKALGYVVIETTDLAKWEHFGTRVMGLMVAPSVQEDGVLYLKMDEYPYRFRIVQGEQDRFGAAGWEVAGPQEFAQAVRELEAAGIACERAPAGACKARLLSEMVAFTAPGGLRCELFYYLQLDYLPLVSPVGVKSFVTGFNGTMGLGHIAAATPDLEASHRFFTAVMGFGQTDYLHLHFSPDPADPGQGLHFLHASNPRHHSLALFQSKDPLPGDLVHLMVEVPDLDTLGGFMDRVHANGVRVITCLGRHTNDRMVSIYVETPAGFALEYGFDGLQIDWSNYVPTFSKRESHWGHRWGQG